MAGMNYAWAINELNEFLLETVLNYPPSRPGVVDLSGRKVTAASNEDIMKQASIVEPILDRVLPGWKSIKAGKSNRWELHREAAIRAKALLERQEEIEENLGDGAPQISASDLHPWVWQGASSLWSSKHYRSAIEDALKKVNAETQNKIGRRDLSETKLFQETFSLNSATNGKPRLRRMKPDSSDTYKSMQRGAMSLAEGIYAGIRNPFNHEDPADIDEQVGLEYLAAISILARWVDESSVEDATP